MEVINMPLVFKVCMGQVGNGNLGNNFNGFFFYFFKAFVPNALPHLKE